jgi:hypothetical protein
MLHLRLRPVAETQPHDDHIRAIECLGAGQRLLVVGINYAVRIEREEDGALEAVALA